MRTTKPISILFIIVLVMSVTFYGCTSDNSSTGTTAPTKVNTSKPTAAPTTKTGTEEPVENPFADKLTFTWLGMGTTTSIPLDGSIVQELIEERFNVDINVLDVASRIDEQWNLFWATGGSADVITACDNDNIDNLLDVDAVREIPREWLETYSPTNIEICIEYRGEELNDTMQTCKGAYYGVQSPQAKNPWALVYHKEMADAAGYTGSLETIGDFAAMVLAVQSSVSSDKKVYGITDFWGVGLNNIYAAYGIQTDSFELDDSGNVYSTNTTDEYKQALELLASWYEQGILDPEFITDNRDTAVAKYYTGESIAFSYYRSVFYPTHGYILNAIETKPDSDIRIISNGLKGPDGFSGGFEWYPSAMAYQYAIVFGVDTTDEVVIRVLQMQEGFYEDVELGMMTRYGEKGIGWDYSDDGTLVLSDLPGYADESATRAVTGLTLFSGLVTYSKDMYFVPEESVEWIDLQNTYKTIYKGTNYFTNGSLSDEFNIVGTDLETIMSEYRIQVITGDKNLEDDWDAYIALLEEIGLNEYLAARSELATFS